MLKIKAAEWFPVPPVHVFQDNYDIYWLTLGRMRPSRVALIFQATFGGCLESCHCLEEAEKKHSISLAASFFQQQEQQEELVWIGSYNNSKHLTHLTQLSQLYN